MKHTFFVCVIRNSCPCGHSHKGQSFLYRAMRILSTLFAERRNLALRAFRALRDGQWLPLDAKVLLKASARWPARMPIQTFPRTCNEAGASIGNLVRKSPNLASFQLH